MNTFIFENIITGEIFEISKCFIEHKEDGITIVSHMKYAKRPLFEGYIVGESITEDPSGHKTKTTMFIEQDKMTHSFDPEHLVGMFKDVLSKLSGKVF